MSLVVGLTKDYQGDIDLDPSSQGTSAQNDVSIFVNAATGNDLNPGTQAAPYQTLAKALTSLPNGWRKSCLIFLAAGTYQWGATDFGINNANRGFGENSNPPVLIGDYTPVFGPATVTAVNADGSVDVAGITALASGVGDSFAFASPSVTLTDLLGDFINAGVKAGMSITIAGATTPANNGTFLITAVTATTVTFTNPAGVAEPYAGAWNVTIDRYFGIPRFTVLSGPGAGSTRMCSGNTATALIPNTPFTGVAVGSVVQLETPSVTIQMNNNWTQAWSQVGYKGIKFQRLSGNFNLPEEGQAVFEGCILDLTTGGSISINNTGARVRGPSGGPWASMGANNPFSALRSNGLFVDANMATANAINIFNGGSILNAHLARNCDIGCNTNGFISANIGGKNVSITVADCSTLSLNGISAAAKTKISGNRTGTPWIIGGFDNAALSRIHLVDLTNCIGNPIQVGSDVASPSNTFYGRSGAKAQIGDVSGALNNTGVGIKYTKGSYVVIDAVAGAALTTVTGTGGDTQGRVVALDTKTYPAVRTADANGVKGWPDTLATTINNMNRIEPPA